MPIFRHPVVGLDFTPKGALSQGARDALAHVRWLAEQGSVRCTLLHSRAPDEILDAEQGDYEPGPPPLPDALEALVAELREQGIDADLQVTEERAAVALLRAVVRGPCDLVLVGKRALADDGPRLGSTAARLLRTSPCAVWAVRPGTKPPPRRVLAATDLSPVGSEVLYRAGQVATQAGAELHVVHALQLTMEAQLRPAHGDREGWLERERAAAGDEIRDTCREQGCGVAPDLHVGVTSPTRAILECVRRFSPDLVVMGTISRSGIPGLLLGNTAERLLARLDVSLLTLKPADFVCPVDFGDPD